MKVSRLDVHIQGLKTENVFQTLALEASKCSIYLQQIAQDNPSKINMPTFAQVSHSIEFIFSEMDKIGAELMTCPHDQNGDVHVPKELNLTQVVPINCIQQQG